MPFRTEPIHRENVLVVKRQVDHELRRTANLFDSSVILANTRTGQKYVYPGLIMAQRSDTYKYVPYNSGASYGAGSDTAIGILDELLEVTEGDQACSPVFHGIFIEAHCRVFGLPRGQISATIKGHIPLMAWE